MSQVQEATIAAATQDGTTVAAASYMRESSISSAASGIKDPLQNGTASEGHGAHKAEQVAGHRKHSVVTLLAKLTPDPRPEGAPDAFQKLGIQL